ncbi:bifunctional tRNA (5-methylaminomethyl-2-thiouridine)(34)-methyltransferase MnmD/FAD-dependent 5-carboxymethylaminomethyl-2-thiouridine(34) oxidoreductase MnmC [Crenobacter cavernae]|uniref:tRNA 5-methylaminomethyl-2-thiouridine biosynthesis bifunctional protein MnmC n=1 Tax=Crenobacter cavernae TaxID=2290923 RepID=A0ABY0FHB6_9NEIS|nr:bifunctional tRNA (5-methylaminomethyl-2-thiouridine)(34)-methyltransferase MnmD/FAD-dependent 5-carboxymethylaminomethyl-2-thiouridine(34) oxidoreductase MnmC [Crenobacter cavernae]RXZ44188.1 bifunctional tRNA (5-methylaminomethyl-2-thiouridine)(34)-methyltransferase MnmD/FAD-dependent 5-carboxymethylaminomethyl-2-thiouridine(34) oxidoreductase MnmC [Crenobacter cavernae]
MSPTATLAWQDGQPFSTTFGDVYFARESGLAETRHVFLDHNRLPGRFAALAYGEVFTIGETGFGAALNFLAAWQCFIEHAPEGARLAFASVEKYPLACDDLIRALSLWPELAELSEQLINQYRSLPAGFHRFVFDKGRVTLTLMIGDALERYAELDGEVDAWFLDGFTPSRNPEMWRPELFFLMAEKSAPGASFATFTSASFVRRGLADAGFAVEKVPGYGHKREMSHGVLTTPPEPAWRAPWYGRPAFKAKDKTAIIVGGGIAGASTAASLAARGWRVTLLERHDALAREGSGNPQGVLYAKLSPHFTPLTWLLLAGMGYSRRVLDTHLIDARCDWQPCGVLQLAFDDAETKRLKGLAEAGFPQDFLRLVSAADAGDIAGVPLEQGGLFFSEAGWLHPPALIAALASHPGITVRTASGVLELDHGNGLWTARASDGTLAVGEAVVLCQAADTVCFAATAHLPLKAIRGQVSELPATEKAPLKTVLCGEGYIAPARRGRHTLGASFNFERRDTELSADEHAGNLAMLAKLSPALFEGLDAGSANVETLAGRVALRATTPDYLPLVGPVADAQSLAEVYAALGNDATQKLTAPAPWLPGLYVNAGHGARGMVTAPLAGEMIAGYLENEPMPVSRALIDALSPNRFAIRALMRGKSRGKTRD